MSAPMVRAILAGTKTQTRRVIKGNPAAVAWNAVVVNGYGGWCDEHGRPKPCPYGKPGDRLWVREAWADCGKLVRYYADEDVHPLRRKRPSIHMPRWASRITLEVTGVRVERLQDISEADAVAEGCEATPFPGPWWQGYKADDEGELHHQQVVGEVPPDWMIEPKRMKPMRHLDRSARDDFRQLWLQINSLESWDANPWVWVVSFNAEGQGR